MTNADQAREVDANYDFFVRNLATMLPERVGQYALIRHQKIIRFFDQPGPAFGYAVETFGPTGFSIQEVTEEPIDLGFFSHVAS